MKIEAAHDWASITAEITRMRDLADDWDGEGTKAPSPELTHEALLATECLRGTEASPPNRVYVGVNATIYFEWFTPYGYVEIEIAGRGDWKWQCRKRIASTKVKHGN